MAVLMKTLIECECYFIRCIKSNEVKKPNIFESVMIHDQIRSLGVLETIKVRKESYPIRRPYMVFYRKYYAVERKFIPFEEISKTNPNYMDLTKE
jgi:myosin heavy subunit